MKEIFFVKGKLFVSSNVQNQFEARLKFLKSSFMARILAYYLYANLFQNITKKDALTFADIFSNSQIF